MAWGLTYPAMIMALPACLLLAGCPGGLEHSAPQHSGYSLSLEVHSPDPVRVPLYDRVDLLLLGNPQALAKEYDSSGAYFEAIDKVGGFYLGGNYLEDNERSSGQAVYELTLPAVIPPLQDRQAWLLCLELQGTKLSIRRRINLDGWPPKAENP